MHLLRTLGSAALFQPAASGVRPVVMHAKRLALLIFLARGSRNALLRRDLLLALLWPELDQAHGRGALRQTLSGLRKQLGPDVLVTQGEEEVGLAPGMVSCDATEFERACGHGEYEAALALYQGDFLAGFHAGDLSPEFEQWVDEERTRLRRLAVTAAWSGAEVAERTGKNAEALSLARCAVDLAPEDEAGVARLISLLDRHGDRSGALAVYDQLVRRLAAEYGVEPSPETRALVAKVRARRSAPSHGTSPANPAAVEALPDPKPGESGESSLPKPAARGQIRRRLILAGVIGALLTLVFVGISAWIRPDPVPANDVVAIAPFRVSAADSSLRWLQEGIVELLSIRLAGDGGLQVIEPGRLLEAWHRTKGAGRVDVAEPAAQRIAQGVGAGRTIYGSVTGTPANLELNAWFLARDGRALGRASVTGPLDSLARLIDRLAGELLGVNAGMQTHELASLVSTSLPATRAFLAGRAAARGGRLERAARLFEQALDRDSTSALAGFELCRLTAWTPVAKGGRACEAAYRGRAQLSPADRALLDIRDRQWINASVMFRLWNQVVSAYPDRPDSWYGLGDSYYHWGGLAGIEDFATRAEDAFRRGWALDSITNGSLPGPFISDPIRHLVELAHMRHDTATVLRLVERVLAVDSTSELARTLSWHRAQLGPESARRTFWEHMDLGVSEPTTRNILFFATWTGIGAGDLPRAFEENLRRLQVHDPGHLYNSLRDAALNAGRPSEVPWMTADSSWKPREALRSRLRQAMSWDGDTLAAREAVRQLRPLGSQLPHDTTEYRAELQDLCTLTQWRVDRGDLTGVEPTVRRLRAARAPGLIGADSASFSQVQELCAALLEAARAASLKRPEARELIGQADSLARTNIQEVCCGEAVNDANVLLARLWEKENEPRRALQAVKRRAGGFMIEPLYLSTFLREEGRLSALLGDTAGAIRAYRHYLALRYSPEPSLKPEVERVRQALAALEPLAASH
jgi:DNA-binding SARP family transcriptional activator/tetratricopeptide (TPR) repeat protein